MPARFAPFLFALILSGIMSFLVTGIATWRTLGMSDGFVSIWFNNWLNGWVVACVTAYFVGPMVRRFVVRVTATPD